MSITRRQFTRAGLAAGAIAALAGPRAFAGLGCLIEKAIPSSGEKVPVIGLGTNRYGVGPSAGERAPLLAALERFHALGGRLIDTAPMYRTSESVLGDLMAELGIRDDLFVATKTDRSGGKDEITEQMRESERRLGGSSLDLMQVHNLIGWQQALPAMRARRHEGHLRYVGITTSRERQYEEFEEVMRAEDLDFIQVDYSLEHRVAAERLLPLAADRGMGVIVNRAFGGGRLFEKVGNEALPEWAAAFECESWAQFLLKYVVSHPAVTVAIPGMTKAHHVDDNLGAARGRLPDASERAKMEAFFDAL